MLKVMTMVGTRPELIKMSRVISELDKQFEHILVHTTELRLRIESSLF